jgi:group I intron endonuclease
MGFIYKITNTINGKMYIGETQSKDPLIRWRRHLSAIKSGRGCPLLGKAINKYGVDKFKFEVLIICFDSDTKKWEVEYIKKYNTKAPNGYNGNDGGSPGANFTGKHHTDETKEKLRQITKKQFETEESRIKRGELVKKGMVAVNIGERLRLSEKWKEYVENKKINGYSDITRQRISESLKNKLQSEDARKKLSETMTKINGRAVIQYSLDGIELNRYDTVLRAAVANNMKRTTISAMLNGHSKTSGGFIWKFDNA